MVLQKGSADGAVRPAGPAAAPAPVITLTLRVFLVSALLFRRTLKSRVLLSMLPPYPLRPWRLFGFYSTEVHAVTASHQPLAVNLCHQKKLFFHSWFKFLLLLCVVLIIWFYIQSSSSLPWLDGFSNQTNQVYLPPPYRVHPKHRPKPNEIYETTESPTVPPTGTLFHQAHPSNYHFIMDNKEVCKTKTPFLVLMVPVAPTNKAARDAIRQTWGNNSLVQGEVVLTLFMLGHSGGAAAEQLQEELKQENLQHRDLIQSDFMDTYLNLTIKTMVIMHWLATRCQTAQYAMKIDSDMFLNIDNLVMMLQKPGIPKLNYLTGMLMWNRPVIRSKNSKWYVSEEMYPDPQYPTYALGMGYVFSNDLPEKFVEVCKSIKPFNIEDAYIGMCMKKLGLAPISPPNSSQFKAYNTRYDRCEYSKIITYILGSSRELVKYWTDLKKPEPPCNEADVPWVKGIW